MALPINPALLGLLSTAPNRAVRGPSGDLYVADGYGHNYMHRFSPDGELQHTWGRTGDCPGEFTLPHNVFAARDGRILVADREPNNRIHIFDADGEFLTEWPGRLAPCGLFVDDDDMVYITEGGGVSILTMEGRLVTHMKAVISRPDRGYNIEIKDPTLGAGPYFTNSRLY